LVQILGLVIEVPVVWISKWWNVGSEVRAAVGLAPVVVRLLESHLPVVVVVGGILLLDGHLECGLLELILVDGLRNVVGVNTRTHVGSDCVHMFFLIFIRMEILVAVVLVLVVLWVRMVSSAA
jgi:hypothetical protein